VDTRLRILPGSPSWPRGLDEVELPPSELWLRGNSEILRSEQRIAIVGSRAPSPYGRDQAHRFARVLAGAGLVVVSGLARGIDQAAHEGALAAGGETIAVLGSGVDRPWPAGPLAEELAHRGLLLSEHAPGEGPRRHHFPLRNRLIAGLSLAVLVVEAAWTSGSLITARWAADLGKTVFVVPGRIDHPMALGIVRLLREGATAVASPEELYEDLLGEPLEAAPPEASERAAGPSELTLALLEALVGETLTVEELAVSAKTDLENVLSELVALELAGRVARSPGGLWRLRG
jgi:DNA processing protein